MTMMKKFWLPLVLALLSLEVDAQITLANTAMTPATGFSGAATRTLASFTLSGTDRMLVVFGVQNAATVQLSDVTVNSISMTDPGLTVTNGNASIDVFYLGEGDLPANGDYDIVLSSGAADIGRAIAFLFTGVADQAPEATNSTTATSSSYSVAVTTVTDDAVVVGTAVHASFGSGHSHTATGDLDEQYDTGAYWTTAGYFVDGAASSVTFSGTFTPTSNAVLARVLAFEAAGGGGGSPTLVITQQMADVANAR